MAQPTEAPRILKGREDGAGPFPYQIAPPSAVRRRRILLFTLLGLVTYLLTLIGTLPARLLVGRSDTPGIWLAVSGTVWGGEAALAHGHAVRWAWAPLSSLAKLSFTTDIEVIGTDTQLDGEASWRRNGVVIEDLAGTASGSLLSALAPSLPFICDFPMRIDIDRIAFGGQQPGASGEVRSSAGTCTARGGLVAASSAVPPLVGEATINVGGSNGWIAAAGNRADKLVSFTVTPNGKTAVAISPSASAIVPGIEIIRSLAE